MEIDFKESYIALYIFCGCLLHRRENISRKR
jgi:hypothetical protein